MSAELHRLAALGWDAPEPATDGVRYLVSPNGSAVSYPEEGFEVLGLEGGAGFWFDHRADAVRHQAELLGISSMWEVGAGTGAMAQRLRSTVRDVVTVEPLRSGARASAALGMTSLCGTLEDVRLPDQSIEAVGAFDVLEHVEDPASLIDEIHRILRPGGAVMATVPAFQSLWGDEDDVAGHYRRYTRSLLDRSFATSRFRRVRSQYLFASLVPLAGVLRALPYRLGRRSSNAAVLERMRRQLTVKPSAERLARAALATESAISRVVPLPFGLSVLGVYSKR
ncbi:class I SAM-dependent methyltransferase [soil metagenome]